MHTSDGHPQEANNAAFDLYQEIEYAPNNIANKATKRSPRFRYDEAHIHSVGHYAKASLGHALVTSLGHPAFWFPQNDFT